MTGRHDWRGAAGRRLTKVFKSDNVRQCLKCGAGNLGFGGGGARHYVTKEAEP